MKALQCCSAFFIGENMATRSLKNPLPAEIADESWGSRAPSNEIAIPDDDEPQTDVDRVAALLQQGAGMGRASVKIYKMENGKSVYCESYQPGEFEDGDFSMIRDAFGAGSYKIMLYGELPTGGTGLRARTEITIAESRITPRRDNPTQQNDGLAQVIAMLADGQKQMLETLTALKSAPAKDPMDEMSRMLGMMTAMRTAMGLDVQQSQPKSQISEIIAAVRELRGVSEELNPPKESDADPLLSMLPQALELIKTGMAQSANQNAQQATQNPAPLPMVQLPPSVATAPVQTPATPVNPLTPEDDEMFKKLMGNLNALLAMADLNKSPLEGAQFVYDELPDEFINVLDQANWFDLLAVFAPQAIKHKTWLMMVRDTALAMFDEPEETDTTPPEPSTPAKPVLVKSET
jgi:hypothetical protein